MRLFSAMLLGAGLGLFFDIFRIVRIAVPHRSFAVAAEDIIFWTVAAFATFLFFFCSDKGRIRLFLLFGEAIGFILWYFTMGVLVTRAAKKVIAVITWLFQWVNRIFIKPVVFLFRWIAGFFCGVLGWLWNMLKKPLKNSNIRLQKYGHLLYNQRKLFKKRLHNK